MIALAKPWPRRAPAGGYGADISAEASIAEAAPVFRGTSKPLRVIGADGKPCGRLEQADVVELMMQG